MLSLSQKADSLRVIRSCGRIIGGNSEAAAREFLGCFVEFRSGRSTDTLSNTDRNFRLTTVRRAPILFLRKETICNSVEKNGTFYATTQNRWNMSATCDFMQTDGPFNWL